MEVVDASASGTTTYQCMPEQAALIKSILNFLKKAIPDPMFTENIRNCKSRTWTLEDVCVCYTVWSWLMLCNE